MILGVFSLFTRLAHTVVYALPAVVAVGASGFSVTSALITVATLGEHWTPQWSYNSQIAALALSAITMALLITEKYVSTPYDEFGRKIVTEHVPVAAKPINTNAGLATLSVGDNRV